MGGMIGKSAWGTNDWFSLNPRLDSSSSKTSLNTTSSSISSSSLSLLDSLDHPPSSLSPTPSSPFSFHALNHGVLDRYDLVPTSFSFGHLGHEFGSVSEIGLGDSQSTFSDDIGMYQPTGFRGFTHHSSYAGDLIFGARTHQPQPFTFGLGLSGMQESSGINPMQLHAPSLPLNGIDELDLTGINGISLNDAGPSDLLLTQQDQSQSQARPTQTESLTLDDLVDLDLSLPESHLTPPGTPLLSGPPQQSERPMRAMRTRSVNLHSGSFRFDTSSAHGRSISVPPGEERDRMFRQSAEVSGKPQRPHAPPSAFPPPFLTPLVRTSTLPPDPRNEHHLARSCTTPSELYDLPFLDLHYNHGNANPPPPEITTGQALDLASSSALQSLPTSKPVPVSAPVTGGSVLFGGPLQGNPASRSISSTRSVHHQRGQSAICPQDLLVRSKRKRSSWDGGPG